MADDAYEELRNRQTCQMRTCTMPKARGPLPRLQTDLKLAVRIHKRFQTHGEAAGLAYAVGLVRQMPQLTDKLYALMPPARAQTIRDAVAQQHAAKAEKQATETARLQAVPAQAAEAEQLRVAGLSAALSAAREAGTAVTYLAALPPADRDHLATKDERRAAIALSKTAMLKGKVLAALGCTATELERWHADGRVPHLFTRVLSLEVAGKAQPCRFWAQDVVMAAQGQVAAWRLADAAKPRRTRPPAAPVG